MTRTLQLPERTVARLRLAYCCWLCVSLLLLLLEIAFLAIFLCHIPKSGQAEQQQHTFSRIAVTLLFVQLVFETCSLVSGAGALLTMSQEAWHLHFAFSGTSLSLTLVISLVAVWASITFVTALLIVIFVARVAAFLLLSILKHTVVLAAQPLQTLCVE